MVLGNFKRLIVSDGAYDYISCEPSLCSMSSLWSVSVWLVGTEGLSVISSLELCILIGVTDQI